MTTRRRGGISRGADKEPARLSVGHVSTLAAMCPPWPGYFLPGWYVVSLPGAWHYSLHPTHGATGPRCLPVRFGKHVIQVMIKISVALNEKSRFSLDSPLAGARIL